MKILILFFALISTGVCFASSKILNYNYGNQITRSVLSIYDDGSILHTERQLSQVDQILENPLDDVSLAQLIGLINGAAKGEQVNFGAGQSGNGSSAGSLAVFDADRNIVNIRSIDFGPLDGSPQPVQMNSSQEAREIEKIVFAIVKRKMEL